MKIATFDLETNQLEINDTLRLHCVVVKEHATGNTARFTSDRNVAPGLPFIDLIPYLNQFDILIGHNCIDFDFPVLKHIFGWEFKGIVYDTLIISRLQNPGRITPPNCPNKAGPHSVEAWGWRLGRGKVEYEDWKHFTPELMHRCAEDVEIQHMIWNALAEERKKSGHRWLPAIRLTCKLFQHLKRQSEYGFPFDRTAATASIRLLERWRDRIDRAVADKLPMLCEPLETRLNGTYNWVKKPFTKSGQYAAITERWLNGFDVGYQPIVSGPFSRISFRSLDLESNQEVKDFFLSLGWEPKEWNLDKDGNRRSPKLSKDEDFEGMTGGLGKLLARRFQIKHRISNIEGLMKHVRPDGRISTTYTGLTPTARLKHSVVVNIPGEDAFFGKYMRALFTAKEGWKLVGVDSKGNQIRQLAARMGDPEFSHAVLHGTKEGGDDLHSLNQRKAKVANRTLAKNFFYGFIFGAGDAKIGKVIGQSTAAGKALKEEYLNGLPKLRDLIQDLQGQWRATAKQKYNPKYGRMELADGYIIGIDGRPIFIDSEHKALNYALQSDEAIQMALAYCWFHSQMEKRGYQYYRDWGMLIWYHDEYQLECRPEIVEEAKALAEESIAEAGRILKINIEHAGDAKDGFTWRETH